jgi:hypothetical protein
LTHTQRTLKALKQAGRKCGVVERFNAWVGDHGIRQDLFGCIDVIALDLAAGRIVGVQSTGADFSGHYNKITQDCRADALLWLQCGGVLELWAWRKVLKKRGGKQKVWQPRVHVFTIEDFAMPDHEVWL